MSRSTKKIILISTISAVFIIGVGFIVNQVSGGSYIPDEFFSQRLEGARAAKHIAQLVENSLANLKKISDLNRAGNAAKALELVAYERTNTPEKHNAAVRLSGSLERMAKATENIKPASARELSVQAVSTGVALVSRIISYNNLLGLLFEALNAQLSSQSYVGPTVKQLIESINTEAQEINQLSQRFNSLLDEFDKEFIN